MALFLKISEYIIRWNKNLPAGKKTLRRWFLTVLTVMAATTVVTCQENTADINWLTEVLDLQEGAVVADIGAGDGDQTLAIARHVGTEGQVYSTELGEESLQELRESIEASQVRNVTVVEAGAEQTNLPPGCCDAIFMRRVYHHITDPASMNASLWQSLKPGGRLAVIDFEPRDSEAEPGGRASGDQHGVTADTIVKELSQAGFVLISSEQRSGRNIYVVVEKPEDE